MFPNRNINYVPAPGRVDPSMSRLPVIPLGSYLFPQTRSALGSIRTTATAPAFSFSFPYYPQHLYTRAPPPFYPWFAPTTPAPLYHPPPLIPLRFLRPPPQFFGRSFRQICSTNGLRMERPETEREPPPKRRKSSEENNTAGKCLNREKDVERTKHSGDVQSQRRTSPKQDSGAAAEARTKEQVEGSNPWTATGAEKTSAHFNHVRAAGDVPPLQRHWEPCPLRRSDVPLPPGGSAGFDFTVMSYNILSQDLLVDNSYLYRHCDPLVLLWEYRLPRILREIQAHDADILCLQEVQEDHFIRQIRPALEALGYQCEYKKRTGYKSDGCAVVFKTSRLSLLSANPVEYFRRGDTLLDRDNVGLVVRLSPASDPASSFCVANTHLLYNPRRGDIKLAQLAILLAEVKRMSRLPDGSTNPVLLCGDFNSTPWSPLYRFLTTGCLDYKGMPIGMVSGQEKHSRTQRQLCCPLWSKTLGINSLCQYQEGNSDCRPQGDVQEKPGEASCESPTVEGAISDLTVDDDAPNPSQDVSQRWRVSHSLKLLSSYDHRLSPDGREEITTCHSRTAITVDYILYTPDSPAGPSPSSSSSLPGGRGLQLLGRLSLVGLSELEQVNGLPNRNHSSDHLPLLARFRLLQR
uniref:Angel homolog 2 (Drosophila) n=2 Tax=Neogobius melanostomus TaxID=47308 RepID=A0A8C6TQE6_9GOBI